MTRSIELSRDEAELLDTLLEQCINAGGPERGRAADLAEELQQMWGMTSFARRKEIRESVGMQPD